MDISTTVDIVIISQNPDIQITALLQVMNCRQIVIDASNPAWKARRWQQQCFEKGINCHNVADKGAFVMKWL
jgi:competence protein ComEC